MVNFDNKRIEKFFTVRIELCKYIHTITTDQTLSEIIRLINLRRNKFQTFLSTTYN